MKKIFLLLFVSVCFTSIAQTELNNYKYVIVPNSFGFLKEANQYDMNALAQFLFEKKGFTAIMESDDIPTDLNSNGCLALRADVLNESSIFTTKLKVVLKDCKTAVVYETELGTSKEKDYKKGYQAALRDAFDSFDSVNYKYEENSSMPVAASVVTANAPVTPTVPAAPVVGATVATSAVTSNAVSAAVTPVTDVLYAQEIPNGYQLVDSSPKVVYKLKKTKMEDVFLVEGQQATVHKSGDDWVIGYYEGDTLKEVKLNIKF